MSRKLEEHPNGDYAMLAILKKFILPYKIDLNRIPKAAMLLKERIRGKNLSKLAYYQKTQAVIRKRLCHHPRDVKYIPHDLLSPELLHFPIGQGRFRFRNIPKHMRSKELALKCVTNQSELIIQIPHKFQTQEIADIAVANWDSAYRYVLPMRFIANRFKTKENALRAVKGNVFNIEYIPHNLITQEIADIIIRDGKCVQYLPEHFANPESINVMQK